MNPPYRVLAQVGRSRRAYWLIWREMISAFVDDHGSMYRAADVRPVNHPKNDSEAIAIIEQAKKTRSKSA